MILDDRDVRNPPIWLLTLSIFGELVHLASEDCTIASEREGTRYFVGGLPETSVASALSSMGGSPAGEPVATFSDIYIPGALARYGQGLELLAGRGELAVIARGEQWERRLVLCSGRVRESRIRRGDFVDLTLGDMLGDDRGTLIPVTAVVNADTWSSPADNAQDQVYPVVMGEPGVYKLATGATAGTTGSPAPMVDNTGGAEILLISLYRVEAQSVRIICEDDGSNEVFNVTTTTDSLGQQVSVVSLAGAATLTVDEENTYYVRWNNGGGILDHEGQLLEGAGSILIWALNRSSLRFDRVAFEGAREVLDRYKFGGFVNDTGFSPVEWLADNILPLLPVSMGFGRDGLYPTVHRWGYVASDVEVVLSEDDGEMRISDGGVGVFGSPISGFRLTYAWSVVLGRGRRRRVVTGDPVLLSMDAANVEQDVMCARAYDLSERIAGVARAQLEEIETRFVYDEGTARLVLTTMAQLRAIPPREVMVDVSWAVCARLRLGQIVQIKSRDFALDRPCRVGAIDYAREGARVRLLLDADPERDRFNR